MGGILITSMLIGLAIGSVIGALILMALAKNLGKISNATFGNSFLVCLISSAINMAIWYAIGLDSLKLGFAGMLILNLVILSAAYITVGKMIWKCEWMQSVKANIVWIVLYALSMGYTLNQFS